MAPKHIRPSEHAETQMNEHNQFFFNGGDTEPHFTQKFLPKPNYKQGKQP